MGKWTRPLISSEDLLPRHGAVGHPAAWEVQDKDRYLYQRAETEAPAKQEHAVANARAQFCWIYVWCELSNSIPYLNAFPSLQDIFPSPFYSFSFSCIRLHAPEHTDWGSTAMTSLQATRKGQTQWQKNITSWKTRAETFLFWQGLAWQLMLYIKWNIKCLSLSWQTLLHMSAQIYFRHQCLFEANHSSV